MADINEELSSITSDCSFVILGNGSPSLGIESLENQNDILHNLSIDTSGHMLNMKSPTVSLNCSHSVDHETPNDIQEKLDQLVKDNLLLKETLNQSNIAMKNQFSTLSMWHDEAMKTYEAHKQKFTEAQQQVSKLEMENTKLKKMIEENLESCTSHCGAATLSISEDDIVELKRSLELSEENCKQMSKKSEELSVRNKELEKRLSDLSEEKLHLEKKLEEALLEIEKLKKNDEVKNVEQSNCQSLLDSNNRSERSSLQSVLDPDMSLISKLSFSTEGETEMQDTIVTLKKLLAEKQKSSQQNNIDVEQLKAQNEKLLKDKEELQNTFTVCRKLMEQFRDQIKTLTVQMKIKEDTLEKKTIELELVKKEMQKLVLDCEEVAILRAQVELYQNDFNEERIAREKAVGAREEMAEELRLLKRKIEEQETKDQSREVSVLHSGSLKSEAEEEKGKPHVCPLCNVGFKTSDELRNHVEGCLNVHGIP